MLGGTTMSRMVGCVNAGVAALTTAPLVGGLVGRHIAMITYTGRRSGRTFSTPIGYRWVGSEIRIGVQMPDAKAWWRNFLGDGGPVSLHLNGVDRHGHAVSRRDERGRVTVTVRLDQP